MLLAVRQLIDEKQIARSTVVKFIGNVLPSLLETVDGLHLENNVVIHHYLPHRKAMQELNASDLLFMLTDPESHIFPSRQAEYLATGCPILLIGADTSSELLAAARTKHAYPVVAVRSDDLTTIKDTICRYHMKYRDGHLLRRPLRLSEFNRQEQARRIAGVLDEIIMG
jgi:glycosyltransferase involved in cell wall biosynthesis